MKWFGCLSFVLLVAIVVFFASQADAVSLTDLVANGLSEHPMPTRLALLCGAAAALPWCGAVAYVLNLTSGLIRAGLCFIVGGAVTGLTVGLSIFLYDATNDIEIIDAICYLPGFEVEEIAIFGGDPVRLAVDDKQGVAYVSYYNGDLNGVYDGGIYRVNVNTEKGVTARPELAASSPLLYRPYGLAVRDGDLYVARSGIYSSAKNGKIENANLGAVTRLSDLDGDGIFEFFHDVITGIPGSRGPDGQHQNNGIAFDPDGNLFMAVGSNGDRTLDEHPWGGTVLRASADFQNIEVFAKGFRNPFAIAVGSESLVFVNDNDVRSNPGDEINHVQRGHHYGHPFVVGKAKEGEAQGFGNPMFVALPNSNLNGLAYAGSSEFPESCRGCVFFTDRPANKVFMLKLIENGETFEVDEAVMFATILNAVDICCTDSGDIYVLSRVYRRLYRIRATAK